jgi:hypothetical protein
MNTSIMVKSVVSRILQILASEQWHHGTGSQVIYGAESCVFITDDTDDTNVETLLQLMFLLWDNTCWRDPDNMDVSTTGCKL